MRVRLASASISNARAGLFYFRAWLGDQTPVDAIDPARWQDYYLHLIGDHGPGSVVTRRKYFRYARNFLRWLDYLGVHPAPRNLDRRQYRFKGGDAAVPTLTPAEVGIVVAAADGQLRLHLLLMLNCGFGQQDLSDLHPGEVDWEHGRVRRKRSKTGHHARVPAVDYLGTRRSPC
jgi:integrase